MRVTIEKMVYGGAGLARTENGVVFVSRAAPGDVAEIELTGRKKDYATARIVTLLEPSPDRREPDCPNYNTVGCCHWQHLQYPSQLAIKDAILRETLQRTARVAWSSPIPVISGPDEAYRMCASFHVHHGRLGFVEERSHRVVPIARCSALCPELNAFVAEARIAGASEVHAVCGPPVLAQAGKERVEGTSARVNVLDVTYELHPAAFFQSNRFLLEPFVREVVERTSGAKRVLELFCGSGFFTIPLARHVEEVLGVEFSRSAIRQARVNAQLNRTKNVRFHEGAVEDVLRASPELRPDVVLLNPPREGAGKASVELLVRLEAPRIVYVSCNPSTFAREAAQLAGASYRLAGLTFVDQFPNTHHIELVATLEK